eukprot:3033875-Amphidinium_carterae.2
MKRALYLEAVACAPMALSCHLEHKFKQIQRHCPQQRVGDVFCLLICIFAEHPQPHVQRTAPAMSQSETARRNQNGRHPCLQPKGVYDSMALLHSSAMSLGISCLRTARITHSGHSVQAKTIATYEGRQNNTAISHHTAFLEPVPSQRSMIWGQ